VLKYWIDMYHIQYRHVECVLHSPIEVEPLELVHPHVGHSQIVEGHVCLHIDLIQSLNQ